MKKIVMLLVLVVMITTMEAKSKKDPVIMTVAGKEILLSEFLFMAKRGDSVDFNDKKSVENYVELFKNYKQKVADAENLTIHETPKFVNEMEKYKNQLIESYLSDKESEDAAIRTMYERSKVMPSIKTITFRYEKEEFVSRDTVAIYAKVKDAYNRIKNGESFESVGESLSESNKDSILYSINEGLLPLNLIKDLGDVVYSMKPGEVSLPFRSIVGYHLIKLDSEAPNPGTARIAQILTDFQSENPTDEEIEAALKKSESIYQKAIAGEDFFKLAETFSDDSINGRIGGVLPYFGLGDMMDAFEKTAFSLENIGDISKPVQSLYGFHVIKLLDRKPVPSYEEREAFFYEEMKNTDYKIDLFRGFDEKMKARHGYVFYPEAYKELQLLAEDYFPTDTSFLSRGVDMHKTLVSIDSVDFPQGLFVEFIYKRPYSRKPYSQDFLDELFTLFVRDIITEIERSTIERDYPEFDMVMNIYYDGTLLYEISNRRLWSKLEDDSENHDKLEAEWMTELKEKYPVVIDKKLVKNIKKYLN